MAWIPVECHFDTNLRKDEHSLIIRIALSSVSNFVAKDVLRHKKQNQDRGAIEEQKTDLNLVRAQRMRHSRLLQSLAILFVETASEHLWYCRLVRLPKFEPYTRLA